MPDTREPSMRDAYRVAVKQCRLSGNSPIITTDHLESLLDELDAARQAVSRVEEERDKRKAATIGPVGSALQDRDNWIEAAAEWQELAEAAEQERDRLEKTVQFWGTELNRAGVHLEFVADGLGKLRDKAKATEQAESRIRALEGVLGSIHSHIAMILDNAEPGERFADDLKLRLENMLAEADVAPTAPQRDVEGAAPKPAGHTSGDSEPTVCATCGGSGRKPHGPDCYKGHDCAASPDDGACRECQHVCPLCGGTRWGGGTDGQPRPWCNGENEFGGGCKGMQPGWAGDTQACIHGVPPKTWCGECKTRGPITPERSMPPPEPETHDPDEFDMEGNADG